MLIAATPVGRRVGAAPTRVLVSWCLLLLGGCGEALVPRGDATDSGAETDVTSETDEGPARPDGWSPTAERDGADLDSAEPDTDLPDTNEPDTNLPDTNEPDTNLPDTNEPDTTEPDTGEPDTGEPDASEPDTVQPDTVTDPRDTDDTNEVAPSCSPCATGRIRFERRRPNPALTGLGSLELAPLANHPLGLVGTTHHTLTDVDGTFTLPLPPGANCHLTFAALLPRDATAPFTSPSLAVLSTDQTALPPLGAAPFAAERLWAWSSTCQPDVHLDLVIRLSEGAGALSAFDTARQVLTSLTDHFGPTDLDLAIVWQRGRAWSCGSCYLDGRFAGVTHTATGHHFPRAIFLSGNNTNPHQFTPSIIAHELGHFALELWSSPPLVGGAHGFDLRVDPVLAWSEGAATVIGQWALGDHTPLPHRFFAVQQNVQYWVDLEAIGRSPVGDDSNLNLFVPMPRPLDPLDQPLSEGVVAAILWDLIDASTEHPGELIALGSLLLSQLSDPRLTEVRAGGLDRGALGPDLVDLLDALRCDPTLFDLIGPPSTLPAPLTNLLLEFPYDDLPLCGAQSPASPEPVPNPP